MHNLMRFIKISTKNPKSEIRNPKQTRISNDQNSKLLEHLNLEFVSNFEIRISNLIKIVHPLKDRIRN
jgi:hypothetical protein